MECGQKKWEQLVRKRKEPRDLQQVTTRTDSNLVKPEEVTSEGHSDRLREK